MEREILNYDVVIVGAGPSGLATAIRLKQLSQAREIPMNVCVLEKGAAVGAHILSGAVIEPHALNTLFPDWQQRGAPLHTPAIADYFYYLSAKRAWRLPTPALMRNHGNYIISLSQLCRWLAEQAQMLGVEIFPGFAAADILYDDQDRVCGVITNDVGINKEGEKTANYQPGVAIHAKQIVFAEGCRGSLTERVIEKFNLRDACQPQTYALGVKELWEVDSPFYKAGTVMHTVGWPLDHATYGGSFIYHLHENKVAVGFVVGLDYQNPSLNPFEEMQRFKTHPRIASLFKGGKRIEYGARALNEGGWQSTPRICFPGGILVGDCAGFLNVPKIKGTHTAMESGIIAAEHLFNAFSLGQADQQVLSHYAAAIQESRIWEELYRVRNIRPAFHKGLWPGLIYAALDTYIFRGHAPWTFNYSPDHLSLKQKNACKKISYPKPDGVLTFDRLSSVYLSNTYHDENQPCHLKLKNPEAAININYMEYGSPEQYYCPASVYEIVYNSKQEPRLQINAQNCIHCKTCDIKDPMQNIVWTVPQGGEGPNYTDM